MTFLVLPPVTLPRVNGVCFWRYDVSRASAGDVIANSLRAICFVSHDDAAAYVYRSQNILGDLAVIYVAAGKMQPDGVAQSVHYCMDFRVSAAA